MTDNPKLDGDLLISRIVDGEASDADWTAFRAIADREPSLWRELAEYQRDQSDLSAAVASAIRVADDVEAPVHEEMGRRFTLRTRLVSAWGGWAAAAVVGLAWMTGQLNSRQSPVPGNESGLVQLPAQQVVDNYVKEGKLTPEDLYTKYLDAGREQGLVVGEVPDRRLINVRPMKAGGGYEIVFLRQIMERTRVKQINGIGITDWGQQVPVPIEIAPPVGNDRY
jgi:hypothetical protein